MNAPDPAAHAGDAAHWSPSKKPKWVLALIAVLALSAVILIAAAFNLFPFEVNPSTDDAYIRGRTTVIAPEVSGYVAKVMVEDYASVHRGDVLVEIDTSSYQAKVDQTRASLALQKAQLDNNVQALASGRATLGSKIASLGSARVQWERSQADFKRAEALVGDGSISVRERDQTRATYEQSVAALSSAEADLNIAKENIRAIEVQREALGAQVEGARAQLDAANVDIGHTQILAPEDGQLSEVGVHVGQFVTNGTQMFSLVPVTHWVIANFKEAQTQHIEVGQPASFRVDALGGARFEGSVERISPAAGAEFAAIKPDNASGNFVKVPQRIGVRIKIYPNQSQVVRLRPGMSVDATVDVSSRSSGSRQNAPSASP